MKHIDGDVRIKQLKTEHSHDAGNDCEEHPYTSAHQEDPDNVGGKKKWIASCTCSKT